MRPARGFTLVELMVALFVMAMLAALAWQGVDGLLRTREATRDVVDATLRLNTVLTQWEQDLAAVQTQNHVPALHFDGRTLRLTRRADGGLQVVAWSVRDGAWWRWASPVTPMAEALQQSWFLSQQLGASSSDGPLRLLDVPGGGGASWQVYFYRGNAWSNAQSTGDLAAAPPPGAPAPPPDLEQLPSGVRIVLPQATGTLTRDVMLPAQPPTT